MQNMKVLIVILLKKERKLQRVRQYAEAPRKGLNTEHVKTYFQIPRYAGL